MLRMMILAVCLLWLAVAAASAQPVVHGVSSDSAIGTYELLPDTPGQTIEIFVSGGQAVQGLNFNLQIADGGPEAGGSIDGPVIESVDLFAGTIFQSNNTGLGSGNGVLVPQVAFFSTTTQSGTVSADGLLATVLIDTSSFFEGSFDLVLSETVNSSTNFGSTDPDLTPVIVDGQITIVPEPVTMLSLGIGSLALVVSRRR